MKCPKCGYERQPKDNLYVPATECPSCGIVYAKGNDTPLTIQRTSGLPLSKRPSPVDEATLKHARERVEMRLRRQLQKRFKDDRHALTLKRAREIATAEAQKRLAEKQDRHQHRVTTSGDKSATGIEDRAVHGPQTAQHSVSEDKSYGDGRADAITSQPLNPMDFSSFAEKSIEPDKPSAADQGKAYRLHRSRQAFTGKEEDQATDSTSDPAVFFDPRSKSTDLSDHRRDIRSDSGSEYFDRSSESGHGFTKSRDDRPVSGNAGGAHRGTPSLGSGLMRLLPVVAWLILVAGLAGAVLSWTTLGDVQASVHATPTSGLEALPLGLLLGFAYLATGVLGFAFFWVASMITRQLKDIRRLLLVYPPSLSQGRKGI